jgi:glycosyltransferase involved in cell wall biosynthesis
VTALAAIAPGQPAIYSMEPVGWTGGRVYLRMIHNMAARIAPVVTLPDLKRGYPTRRWRKLRHLAALAPAIRPLRHARGIFVWDDLSLLWFTPAMRRRTIFVFHHQDPLHYDSAPVEPLLWHGLFAALRQCASVVCVSPYWAAYLAVRGIRAQVIYNSFDLPAFDAVRAEDRQELRRQFGLPTDRILIYVGKAVHGKGTDVAQSLLRGEPDLCLVSTGNNTIGARTLHIGWLPYLDHLQVIRACEVGLFLSTVREGWSRCAAEAILLDLPCLTSGIAGLGDLARLTHQPNADPAHLASQVRARRHTSRAETAAARQRLSEFDARYFSDAWTRLLTETMVAAGEAPRPLPEAEPLALATSRRGAG